MQRARIWPDSSAYKLLLALNCYCLFSHLTRPYRRFLESFRFEAIKEQPLFSLSSCWSLFRRLYSHCSFNCCTRRNLLYLLTRWGLNFARFFREIIPLQLFIWCWVLQLLWTYQLDLVRRLLSPFCLSKGWVCSQLSELKHQKLIYQSL